MTPAESEAVRAHLAGWLRQLDPSTVLLFAPMAGEVDLLPLRESLPGVVWAITRTPEEGWLTVHPLGSAMERHRFGYLQPVEEAPLLDPSSIEVALVPGLLFDRRGGRLGRGRGFFDELLTRLGGKVVKVGVTVERRVVDAVPLEPGDVVMDYLATERGVYPRKEEDGG